MSERTPRIKRLLIFITVFLCLICGILFTQSSTGPFENSSTSVISVNTSDISAIEPGSDRDHHTDASISSGAPSPSATPSPVPTEIPETEQVSPEAENGVWTPDGTNWKFMVDGTAYTGWLTDTDAHRYYFNKDGIMQTGWITLGKKRYYLDEDGIMQTGTITVSGKNTHWHQTVHSKNDLSLYQNNKNAGSGGTCILLTHIILTDHYRHNRSAHHNQPVSSRLPAPSFQLPFLQKNHR